MLGLWTELLLSLGTPGTIDGHQLQVLSSQVLGRDDAGTPDGSLVDVGGSPLDLRWPTLLDRRLGSFVFDPTAGLDHSYLLDYPHVEGPPAATLTHSASKLRVAVNTDQPFMHLKSAARPNDTTATGGAIGFSPIGLAAAGFVGNGSALTYVDGTGVEVTADAWVDPGEVHSAFSRFSVTEAATG